MGTLLPNFRLDDSEDKFYFSAGSKNVMYFLTKDSTIAAENIKLDTGQPKTNEFVLSSLGVGCYIDDDGKLARGTFSG